MIIDPDNNPWFKETNIARILEYKDTNDAIRKHVNEDDKLKLEDIFNPGKTPG